LRPFSFKTTFGRFMACQSIWECLDIWEVNKKSGASIQPY